MTYDYAYRKRYNLDKTLGRPRTVPAGPVRAHIARLRDLGWSWRGIADSAQISLGTAHTIYHSGQSTVMVGNARAILALDPESIHDRPNVDGFVPALGTRRRIRALMAIGWTHADLRARSGINTASALSQAGDWVSRSTRDAIARAYEELSMTPGPSAATRGRARRLGYAPPLAWDEGEIDDPTAEPHLDEHPRPGRPGADLDDFVHLVRSGESPERAARRMGVAVSSIERQAHRTGRPDVLPLLTQSRDAA